MEIESDYSRGYADALEDMRKRRMRKKEREQERKARRWYFLKQKAMGAALLALTVVMVKILEGDATIALITVPLGLYMICSREMMLINGYYWETKERETHGRKNTTAH